MTTNSKESQRVYQATYRAKRTATPDMAAEYQSGVRKTHNTWVGLRGPVYTMLRSAKMRSKREGVPFDLKENDVQLPTHCPVLGIPLFHGRGRGKVTDNSPSLDRMIPSLGYVKGNVSVISFRANSIKRDATADDLIRIANWIRRSTPTDTSDVGSYLIHKY